MATYELTIEEELNQEILEIAEAASRRPEDILYDFVVLHLRKEKVNLIVQQYKEGNIKAREAWKLSGLTYQEFQDLVNI